MKPKQVCTKCKLSLGCKSPYMDGRGLRESPEIAFVGDVPGFYEDKFGQPFVGDPWRLLRLVLKDLKVAESSLFFTNAVRCRPAEGKTSKVAQNSCREFLFEELAAVRPKLIFALGSTALFALTGKEAIRSERGKCQLFDLYGTGPSVPFVASYHPAYCLRNPESTPDLAMDIQKALRILRDGFTEEKRPATDYKTLSRRDQLPEFKQYMRRKVVSWDIESTGVKAFAESAAVVCVSFCTKKGTGWVVPLQHAAPNEFTMEERVDLLRSILTDSSKYFVGHNLKFDQLYVWANLGFRPVSASFDTLLAHHLLNENAAKEGDGHGLKALAQTYTLMGGYEEPVMKAFPDFYAQVQRAPFENSEEPEACLKYYACGDVDVTFQVAGKLAKALEENGQGPTLELELRKQEILTEMEFHGAAVDWQLLESLRVKYRAEIAQQLTKLRSLEPVRRVSKILGLAEDSGDMIAESGDGFNPGSPKQVSMLLFKVLGLPSLSKTKAGADQTSMAILVELRDRVTKGSLAEKTLACILRLKRLQKLQSAYIEGMLQHRMRDDRIHTTFNQAFVATSRTSAKDPNVQQFPRNDEESSDSELSKGDVKSLIVPFHPDWLIAELDYSQIELRGAAVYSQEPFLVECYRRGQDIHRETAAKVFKVALDKVTDRQRTAAKMVNFGIIYGMGAESLGLRLGLSTLEAQRLIDDYWAALPQYAAWVESVKQFAQAHRYVESLFGHRRHLNAVIDSKPAIREQALRQAVNFPIQNFAANLTLYGAASAREYLTDLKMESLMFLTVHDSVYLCGPADELPHAARATARVMENMPFDFLQGKREGMPLVVPLAVDIKIGKNLRDMKKLKV